MSDDAKGETPQSSFLEVPIDELIATYQRVCEFGLKLNRAKQQRTSAEQGRVASLAAITSTIELIGSIPALAGKGFELPLRDLFWSLTAIDDGVVKPLLKRPDGVRGQRDKERDLFYAYALAIATTFPDKRSTLAARLTESGHHTRKGEPITVDAIRDWGRELEKLRSTDFRRERYEFVVAGLTDKTAAGADIYIARLIERFPPSILMPKHGG